MRRENGALNACSSVVSQREEKVIRARRSGRSFFCPSLKSPCRGNMRQRRGAGENRANIAHSMSGHVGLWPAHFSRLLSPG